MFYYQSLAEKRWLNNLIGWFIIIEDVVGLPRHSQHFVGS